MFKAKKAPQVFVGIIVGISERDRSKNPAIGMG
jgi:hypothetical protein